MPNEIILFPDIVSLDNLLLSFHGTKQGLTHKKVADAIEVRLEQEMLEEKSRLPGSYFDTLEAFLLSHISNYQNAVGDGVHPEGFGE